MTTIILIIVKIVESVYLFISIKKKICYLSFCLEWLENI